MGGSVGGLEAGPRRPTAPQRAAPCYARLVAELSERIREILQANPEIARAAAEVDRTLIRAALERTPMERLIAATAHLKGLRGLKRVSPEGS